MAEVTLLTVGPARRPLVPAFLLFVTIFAYNYHRLFRGRGVQVPARTDRHRWIRRHRRGLTVLMIGSGGVAAWLGTRLSTASVLVLAPFGLVVLFYSVVPFRRQRGIRDLPFVKVFLVALTWSATTAALPLVEAYGPSVSPGLLLAECAERFFFILALTIPFDVRDLPHDDPSKRTIPQLVGVTGARMVSLASLAAFTAIAFLGPGSGGSPSLALGVSAALTAISVSAMNRRRPEIYYTGWLEGMMFIQYLLVRAAV